MAECEHIASGQFPAPGVPGATFVPGVEEISEGYEVSWENNRNLPNPDPVRLLHGKSAYQLAVEAGYEGTEVEFAAEMADAAVAKAKAEAAAEAAGESETNATAAADAAAQSEQNAKDSEEAARQAAGEADQLAQAAAGSAGAASLSEQNAAASEQAAEEAAEEAGNRATAAENAAGAAARSEANAKTSEENAARSEAEAKKAAQEAQGVILSGPAQPGQLLLVESVSEDGKLLKCTAVDRTHGVMVTTYTENTIFDGNIEGRETILIEEGIYFVKVSNRILSVEDLAGATIAMVQEGTRQEIILTSDDVRDAIADMGLPVVMASQYVVSAYETASFNGISFTTGTWYVCAPGAFWVESVSCLPSGEVAEEDLKKLDNKYLDLDWLPIKIPGRKVLLAETTISSKYKVLDCPIHTLAAGDKVFVTYNGTTYTCALKVIDGSSAVGNLSLANAGVDTGEPFLITGNDTITQIQSDGSTYTLSIAADTYVYNTIPSGFLANSYYFPYDVTGYIPSAAINEARAALQNGGVVTCNLGTVLSIFDDGEQAFMWVAGSHFLYNINQPYVVDAVPAVRKLIYEDGWFNQTLTMTSPNGTKYKLVVADDGTLSTEAVTT